MKAFLLFLTALALSMMPGRAAAADNDLQRAVMEIHMAIDAAERAAEATQSLGDLNAAAREQVIRELKLSGQKRRSFEVLYDQYRAALDKAITPVVENPGAGDDVQRQILKSKLDNINATARIKREYVDKFAEILSAEQIRQLYNTEGAISTSIKRAAADRMPRISKLRGSGRMVTQDWGAAGNYTSLVAGTYCAVIINPTARTISVTADDNIIDYITHQNEGGKLEFGFSPNANSIENIHIEITIPLSTALNSIATKSYGKVTALCPLKTPTMSVSVSSYGSVVAEIETSGKTQVAASSYGRFKGTVKCGEMDYSLSSYARGEGSIECRESCQMQVSSYARFTDNITSPRVSLTLGSYAKFSGAVNAATHARISVNSYSSFSGGFVGNLLEASVGSYASMTLSGSAQVADAQVTVAYNASYNAPDLRVVNYNIKASNSSKCNVWCSGVLKIDAPLQASVTYDGPCKVDAAVQNIRRR